FRRTRRPPGNHVQIAHARALRADAVHRSGFRAARAEIRHRHGHPPHRLGLLRRADPRPPRSGGHAAPGPALEAVGKHAGRAVTEPAMTTPPREEARRVSPITPVLNAWKVATALVAFAVWQGRDIVMEENLPRLTVGMIFLGVVFLSALVSLTYNYFAWRRLSYGFAAESPSDPSATFASIGSNRSTSTGPCSPGCSAS